MPRRKSRGARATEGRATSGPIKFGIATKFALAISALVSIGMGILGLVVYSSTRTALEETLDRAGVFAATVAAAPDWHHKDNQKRLQGMLSETVLDVIICEPNDQGKYVNLVASAAGKEVQLKPLETLTQNAEVRIRRVQMAARGGSLINCRSFRRVIYSTTATPRPIAQVEVILSEEAIEDELNSISQSIILITILGIVIGVGIAFFMGRQMTRPILSLVDDLGAISRGSYSHRTHIRTSDELGQLADAFNAMAHGLQEGEAAKATLVSKEHEEQIAQEIQEKLFPKDLPQINGAEVKAVFEPASEIASDLFDFIPTDDGKTGLLVLTASGTGIPAAIVLAMARSVFRAVATGISDPAEALRRINALLAPDLRRGMYVTALYVIFDVENRRASVASAGHKLPAVHHVAEDNSLRRIHPAGIAMGLDKGPVFDRSIQVAEVDLASGDSLLIGSAGITQLELPSGEAIGEQRFFKLALGAFKASPLTAAHDIVSRIDEHVDESRAQADIALITLTVS